MKGLLRKLNIYALNATFSISTDQYVFGLLFIFIPILNLVLMHNKHPGANIHPGCKFAPGEYFGHINGAL